MQPCANTAATFYDLAEPLSWMIIWTYFARIKNVMVPSQFFLYMLALFKQVTVY